MYIATPKTIQNPIGTNVKCHTNTPPKRFTHTVFI